MKNMYTNKPDDTCHKINGVHGRPVNTCDQKALKAAGWVFDPSELAKVEPKKEKDPSITDQAKALGIKTVDESGKTIHYKLLAKAIEAHNGGTDKG